MKLSKRAIRRHHYNRLKKNRRYYWGRELKDDEVGFVVDTPHPCSRYCCGNPRKWFLEISTQEKRQLAKEQEHYPNPSEPNLATPELAITYPARP